MLVWLISMFEQTPIDGVFSTRFQCIAEEALRRGHRVRFIGSTFKHNTKDHRFSKTTEMEYRHGYNLTFVKSPGYRRNISLRRAWAHRVFSKNLVRFLNEGSERPDVVLVAIPPPALLHEITRWAEGRSIPVVMDVIDPWPDALLRALPSRLRGPASPIVGPLRARLRKTGQKLSGTTAISAEYLAWARAYCPNPKESAVFFPAADMGAIRRAVEAVSATDESPGMRVIYAGSLGSSYDIPCILGAAARLEHAGLDVGFWVAGAGPQASLVSRYEREHSNLQYLGRLSKDELMVYYARSDLGLTQHIAGALQSVTYKLFDLLAAGLPVLNSLESEMKDIILQNEVGLHNPPGDAEGLANNIQYFLQHPEELKRYRNNGLALTRKSGDSQVVYGGFVDLLERVAGRDGSLHP